MYRKLTCEEKSESRSGGWLSGLTCLVSLILVVGLVTPSRGQQDPHRVTVATVGNEQVSLAQVQNQVKTVLGDRKVSAEAKQIMMAASTRQLVNQLLVVEYLKTTQHGLSNDQVNLQIERLSAELAKSETTLKDFLGNRNQNLDGLKQQIRWQFGWAGYLKQSLNNENLKKYFRKHQKDFDGTQVRVAHLILGVDPESEERETLFAKQMEKATQIKKQLDDGDVQWVAAVEQFSTSENRKQDGGDLGWIERRKPMPDNFSKAAFSLEANQVSDPVRTKYGVHLIRCSEVKVGRKTLKDAQKEVKTAATKFLFEWIVEQQQAKTEVRYTGAAPYFDPKSGKLVKK